MNMGIHRATCRGHRVEAAVDVPLPAAEGNDDAGIQRNGREGLPEGSDPAINAQNVQPDAASLTTANGRVTQTLSAESLPPPAVEDASQWACPRCTLLNPQSALRCDACLYIRQGAHVPRVTDALGPIYRPDLAAPPQVPPHQVPPPEVQVRRVTSAANTANAILSGAVIGSFLGGGIGALVGAAGGAIMDGVTRWNNRRAERSGVPPTVTFSSVRVPFSGARIVTMRSNRPTSIENLSHADRMILQMLLMSAMSQGAQNADQMTYDELLRHFGVGNDNRGASDDVINALPSNKVENANDLEENEKTCGVCLENFSDGDDIRKLHCSHCFHKNCIDRWLHQVASCPMCKQEIEDLRSEGHEVHGQVQTQSAQQEMIEGSGN